MKQFLQSNTLSTGLATFAMFFGAGNFVFPLAIGQLAQDQNLFAIIGLLISAVLVPFIGLFAMTLFNGDYKSFFSRIGPIPGFIVAAIIMALMGLGALPRCITLSHATTAVFFPTLPLPVFSAIACAIIFLFTIKRTTIIDSLGYFLTPLLIFSLILIIFMGIFNSPATEISNLSGMKMFWKGLLEGYQTMDLLGAFFFSSVVLVCLEKDVDIRNPKNYRRVIKLALKAGVIGAVLLALTYIGFSYSAAAYSNQLATAQKDELPAKIALLTLGPYAGVVVCTAVALACLTTAIALAAIFAEFIHKDLTTDLISYEVALVITLILAFFISTLNFTGIATYLAPILEICYPALILLTILNIAYKLNGFQTVKLPVFLVFAASLIHYVWVAYSP